MIMISVMKVPLVRCNGRLSCGIYRPFRLALLLVVMDFP